MSRWWIWITLWMLMLPAAAQAQVQVRAHVDRTRIAPGESLQLSVSVENGEGEVDLSPLTDFRVVSRGTSRRMRLEQGQTRQEATQTFVLLPEREGRLTIPALDVTVNGRIYRTEPITIEIAEQAADDAPGGSRELWVRAAVSTNAPFVGQQLTYSFSVYQSVQITDASFTPPDFKGFTAKQIENRDSERRLIDGIEYVITTIHYVLSPLNAGTARIEPAVLQTGIVRPETSRRRRQFDDFFNDPFFQRHRVESRVLQSKPISLTVHPLPPLPGKAVFSGLVGRFLEGENGPVYFGAGVVQSDRAA